MLGRARFISYITLLLLITLLARPTSAYAKPETFELSAPSQSREGYFVLSLSRSPQQPLWLDYSAQADFSKITRSYPWFGDFTQITLSGFANGEHYFRVRNQQHAVVSNVISVKVDHYPLWQALSLFVAGLLLFILIAGVIVFYHQRSRADEY